MTFAVSHFQAGTGLRGQHVQQDQRDQRALLDLLAPGLLTRR